MLHEEGMNSKTVLGLVTPSLVAEAQAIASAAEKRRKLARYDTGTISVAAAAYLRAWTLHVHPEVVIEVGTFIGTSTLAMHAQHVYTCDKSNDCLRNVSEHVTCFPFKNSTQMLQELFEKKVKADFFFFDGRIQIEDLPLIALLANDRAVYAFDDYEGNEKGVVNYRRLHYQLHDYALIHPPESVPHAEGRTSIAVMVPK